jgi:23S rRNA pseudouridine2605 synthase
MQERLQKILSRAGIASRRKAELLITSGHVTVNGESVIELGSKADLDTDEIRVDGRLLKPPKELIYVAVNKPRGVVTTLSDPERRKTIVDVVPLRERIYPVGRLDYDSEGLLLMTNDGDFANGITSKASLIEKVYHAKVTAELDEERLERFRIGISLFGRKTAPAKIRMLKRGENPWYEVILTEGRNQQVRLMFQTLGALVEKLRRVRIGFLELGTMKAGEFRFLTAKEVARFQAELAKGAAIRGKETGDFDAAKDNRRRGAVRKSGPPKSRSRAVPAKTGVSGDSGESGGKRNPGRKSVPRPEKRSGKDRHR